MAYKKLYNPTNKEIVLFYGSVDATTPPMGSIIVDEAIAKGVAEMCPRLEVTNASDEDFKAFQKAQEKPEKPKLGKVKKPKKGDA